MRESVEYYQQQLGFRLTQELSAGDYAILERDEVAIHLFQGDSANHSPVAVHIFTEQLEELQRELRQRGARFSQEIVRKPWGNRDFRVKDPAGNEIKFTEPLAEDS